MNHRHPLPASMRATAYSPGDPFSPGASGGPEDYTSSGSRSASYPLQGRASMFLPGGADGAPSELGGPTSTPLSPSSPGAGAGVSSLQNPQLSSRGQNSLLRRAADGFLRPREDEDCVYRRRPKYMWYSAFLLTLSVVLLSADQNLAAPHMSDIAEDFFREACKSDFPGGEKEQDECVEHRKLHQLGGEAQFGFFILGGLSTIVIGPMADVYPRVRLLVTVIWTGALPCLLTLFIPNGVFGFYCFMTQRVLTGISVGGSFPVIYSVLADIFPPTYKAFIGTIVASGTAAGVGLGTFASGIIGSQTGWRFVFCVVAAPSIVLSLFALGTVIEPRRERVLQHGSKSTLGDDEPLTGGAASAGVVRSSAGPTSTSDRSRISATSRAGLHPQQLTDLEFGDVNRLPIGSPPPSPTSGNERPTSAHQGSTRHTTSSQHQKREKLDLSKRLYRGVFSNPTTTLCLLQSIPGCIPWATVQVYVLDYMHHDLHFPLRSATFLIGVFMVSGMVCVLLSSYLANYYSKYSPRKLALLSSLPAVVVWFGMRSLLLLGARDFGPRDWGGGGPMGRGAEAAVVVPPLGQASSGGPSAGSTAGSAAAASTSEHLFSGAAGAGGNLHARMLTEGIDAASSSNHASGGSISRQGTSETALLQSPAAARSLLQTDLSEQQSMLTTPASPSESDHEVETLAENSAGAAQPQASGREGGGGAPRLTAATTTGSRPSGPSSTTSQASSDSAVPEIFLFLLAVLAGTGAVTGPTVKGLLLNVNDSQIRGTVTGLVTLTDDVGKGFAPIVVAHYMQLFGKGYAIGKALDCFLLCAFVNFLTFFTITDDFIHFGRYTDESEANDAALGGGPEEVLHLGEESGGAAPARPGSSARVGPTGGGPVWQGTAGVAGQLSRELGDTPLGRTNFNH